MITKKYIWLILSIVGVPAANLVSAPADGPYPREASSWTDTDKESQREAGREMLDTIGKAAREGLDRITIPKGNYRFADAKGRPAHIVWSDLRNLTVDFKGSNLWFETDAPGIVVQNCKNVKLQNVELDWDPLPFIQGKVGELNLETNMFEFELDSEYSRVLPGMSKGGGPMWRGMVFNKETRELKAGVEGFEVDFSWESKKENGSYLVRYRGFYDTSLSKSGIKRCDLLVILSLMGRAVRINGCVDCTFDKVTVYSSPFVVFAVNAGSNVKFVDCQIIKRPGTDRLIAGNADGFNCGNMDQGATIDSCKIDSIGDDFVNVHGHLGRVLAQVSDSELVCSRLNYRGHIKEPVPLLFFDRQTMTPVGSASGTAEVIDWKIDEANCLADLRHKWHSGEASALDYGKTVKAHRITLDQPIEIKGDIVVVCEQFCSPGAVIRNCDFRGSLARGIRLQSPGALVEKNRVSLTYGAGLTMSGQSSYWGEGPYVHSATVVDNTFTDTCIGTLRPKQEVATIMIREGSNWRQHHIPHDIRLERNLFVRSGRSAIIASGVDNLTIVGNTFREFQCLELDSTYKGEVDASVKQTPAVLLQSIKGLRLENNRIVAPGRHASGEEIVMSDVTQ